MQNNYLNKNTIYDSLDYTKFYNQNALEKAIQDIIASKPFGDVKFYIFSFLKNVDDNRGIKKLYHHPRLTKPEPVPGSMLFRVDPKKMDQVEIKWILPHQESFKLFKKGKLFGDQMINDFCDQFLRNPKSLMQRESDDLSDDQIREIYQGKRKKSVE